MDEGASVEDLMGDQVEPEIEGGEIEGHDKVLLANTKKRMKRDSEFKDKLVKVLEARAEAARRGLSEDDPGERWVGSAVPSPAGQAGGGEGGGGAVGPGAPGPGTPGALVFDTIWGPIEGPVGPYIGLYRAL